ncbi:MAG: esterase [Actinomycetia bacterium]|nr:esterase [Actinomycetes bacterium]
MLSRRSFLLGGAGAVVAAGAGVEVLGRERVLHRLGLSQSPDHRVPPSGWAVDEEHLPGGTPFAWSRPPDGDLAGAVICLHGKGDTHRFAFDEIHLHDVVADEGAQLAVAALDGGEGSYWHQRADGSDPGKVVLDELVPFLRSELGLERFAVLGWSMGGYGALLLGERHPDLFPVVVGSSPALYASFADAAPGAFDDAAQFTRDDVFTGAGELDPSKVRIDCGRQDPFAAADRRFVERLGPKATSSFPRGYHDARFWRSVAGAQIRFIAAS